ncbi:uncharacterized protein DEA37_0013748 [Paragonimus westermani]|uniref:Uncharacterized protein n=1 Tax=Paragonimus westermani TaxID=34504 RepID=A0A5J4NSK4_9TREM|nr:uncharacterized protein DEA37_0013748 [Paragonimus westermani]
MHKLELELKMEGSLELEWKLLSEGYQSQNDHSTDFAHIWSTLLRYEELFTTSKLSDRPTLQQPITLCPSTSDRTCDNSSCPCNGLQFRLGAASTALCPGALSFWAPCSQVFAFQVVMAWAKLSIEEQELKTTNRPDSNLCRASYGVLENWVDLLTLGRLSALATNSVQIEPDAPSFFEESSCPLSPQSGKKRSNKELVILKSDLCTGPDSLVDKPRLVTIVIRDSETEGNEYSLYASCLAPWSKLAHSWKIAVDKRIGQPGTLVVDLRHASQNIMLNTLVTDIMRSRLMFCTNA